MPPLRSSNHPKSDRHCEVAPNLPQQPLSTSHPSAPPIYPAYCNASSPTYSKWVKLTAIDLHTLTLIPSYAGQQTYHHLNHPLRFIYLCGTITSIDFPHPRFALFTLDDGSGRTVDVKIERLVPEKTEGAAYEPRTQVEGMTVSPLCGDAGCGMEHLVLHGEILRSGTVVKAKGVIEVWRGAYQLLLKRASIVKTTAEEIEVWKSYAEFVESTLSKPWVVSEEEVKRLGEESRRQAVEDEKKRRGSEKAQRRRAERRRAWEAKKKAWDERREKERIEEATRLDGNALDRPGWKSYKPAADAEPVDQLVTGKVASRKVKDDRPGQESEWFHDIDKRGRSKEFDKTKRRKR